MHLLNEFDAVCHPCGFINLPDENQPLDDFTDAQCILGTVNDARMWQTLSLEAEKIGIVSENHATLGKPICCLRSSSA